MIQQLINRRRILLQQAAPDPFADGLNLTVDTTIAGGTGVGNLQFAVWSGLSYNYSIDWGDGNVDFNVTTSIVHNYATPGIYTVRVIGQVPRLAIGKLVNSDQGKFMLLNSWGNIEYSSFDQSIRSAENIKLNTANPPIIVGTNVSFNQAFQASNRWFTLGYDMNLWDMSKVSNLRRCFFSHGNNFGNARFDGWDVSNVTNADDFTANGFLSTTSYDLMLNAYANLPSLKPNVIFDVGTTKYTSAAAAARQSIIDNYNWTFVDGGQL